MAAGPDDSVLGMGIPSGPLAYKSDKKPLPLSEREQMIIVAVARRVAKELGSGKRVATLLCDSRLRYLNGELFQVNER